MPILGGGGQFNGVLSNTLTVQGTGMSSFAGPVQFSDGSATTLSWRFTTDAWGAFYDSGSGINWKVNAVGLAISQAGCYMAADSTLRWTDTNRSATAPVSGAVDLLISRPAAGKIDIGTGSNGWATGIHHLTELVTIAAAATTDTTIEIPAGALLFGTPVRVTTVIPTAATFTVTGTTTGTAFNTAAVTVAAGSTDAGTAAGAFYNAAAQTVRITPNLTPGDNTGRVRVVISYILLTPPTS